MEMNIVNENNHAFGHVKQSIMRNTTLSLEAKSIYAYLSSFADNESGECFPSLETILTELNISKNRFYKYLKELEAAGIIERKKRKNASTLYKIINHVVVSAKEKAKALTTKKEEAQTIEKSELLQNSASELLQIETHNNNTINNNYITKDTIETKAQIKNNQKDKELYLHHFNPLIPDEVKELISQYALNQNNQFDLFIAISIEKAILGAKKTATKDLIKQNILPKKVLDSKGYYDLNLEVVNLTETLHNIFYQLRKDRDTHRIKNNKIYLFGTLKKKMKEWIQMDYECKIGPQIPLVEW